MHQECFTKDIRYDTEDDRRIILDQLKKLKKLSQDYKDFILMITNYQVNGRQKIISAQYNCEKQPKFLNKLKDIKNLYNKVELFNKLLMIAYNIQNTQIPHGNIKPSNIISYEDKLYLIDFQNSVIDKQINLKSLDYQYQKNHYPYLTLDRLKKFAVNQEKSLIGVFKSTDDKIKEDIYAIGSIMLYLFTKDQFNDHRFNNINELIVLKKQFPHQIFNSTDLPNKWQNLFTETITMMLLEQKLPDLIKYQENYNQLKPFNRNKPHLDNLIQKLYNKKLRYPKEDQNNQPDLLKPIQSQIKQNKKSQVCKEIFDKKQQVDEIKPNQPAQNQQQNKITPLVVQNNKNKEQQPNDIQQTNSNQFQLLQVSQPQQYLQKSLVDYMNKVNRFQQLDEILKAFLIRKQIENISNSQSKNLDQNNENYQFVNNYEVRKGRLQNNRFVGEILRYSEKDKQIYHYKFNQNNISDIIYYQINQKSKLGDQDFLNQIIYWQIIRKRLRSFIFIKASWKRIYVNLQNNSLYFGNWKDGKEEDKQGIWKRLDCSNLKCGDVYKYKGSFEDGQFHGQGTAYLNYKCPLERSGEYKKGYPVWKHYIKNGEKTIGYDYFVSCFNIQIRKLNIN